MPAAVSPSSCTPAATLASQDQLATTPSFGNHEAVTSPSTVDVAFTPPSTVDAAATNPAAPVKPLKGTSVFKPDNFASHISVLLVVEGLSSLIIDEKLHQGLASFLQAEFSRCAEKFDLDDNDIIRGPAGR